MSIFTELSASLQEAVEIKSGELKPARVTRYPLSDVKAIRAKLGVSQESFADVIGASLDTVKSWEGKRRNPSGLAARVISAIDRNPAIFTELAAVERNKSPA